LSGTKTSGGKIFKDTMAEKRNLVMGAVRGYNFEQLRPFVVSLKRTTFDGDLVLLWNNLDPETLAALRSNGVKLVHFSYRGSGALNSWSRFWPILAPVVRLCNGSALARKILKSILPLQSARFIAYHDFLAAHPDEYQNVLVTDVRDVLFQADPFSGFKGGLLVFEEDGNVRLADEKMCNAKWVEKLFGPEALARIGRFPILCSGTVMGDSRAMTRYLMEFETLLCRARNVAIGGSDQGLHNYLCRFIMEPWFQVLRNGEGPILTMVPTLKTGVDFQVSGTGLVFDSNGLPVPVLHQYDRHPDLAAGLIRKLVEEEPLPARENALHESST
jgi:hypothetical protein